jgi:hypothetical protein
MEVDFVSNRRVAFDGTDHVLVRVREHRNKLLAESDWTQTIDAPLTEEKQAEWATYRQALRDLPSTVESPTPNVVTFPDPPQ